MASIITATTSSGLTHVADNSGVLQLASGVGNLVTVPSVTGTAMVSGNQPAFSAYQSTLQSVSNVTFTKVQLQTEEFDTASAFDSTTNYRFTPQVAGYYQVSGYVGYTFISGTAISVVYKNGSRFKDGVFSSGQTDGTGTTVDCLIYLNGSTDYIELYTYQRTGLSQNTVNSANSTYFQAVLVRTA
jgi:hypothetical protein